MFVPWVNIDPAPGVSSFSYILKNFKNHLLHKLLGLLSWYFVYSIMPLWSVEIVQGLILRSIFTPAGGGGRQQFLHRLKQENFKSLLQNHKAYVADILSWLFIKIAQDFVPEVNIDPPWDSVILHTVL